MSTPLAAGPEPEAAALDYSKWDKMQRGVESLGRLPGSVLGYWGNTVRGAVRTK